MTHACSFHVIFMQCACNAHDMLITCTWHSSKIEQNGNKFKNSTAQIIVIIRRGGVEGGSRIDKLKWWQIDLTRSSMLHTLLLLLLTGTIFSYFCMSSITSVLILAILIAIVLF